MKKEIMQKLVFNGVTFKKRADFKNLIFTQDANFSNTRFEDNVYFNHAEFKKEADFHESEYERVACFYEVRFKKIPNFSSAIFFADSKLNLINSTLSKPSYSFEDLKEKIEEKISKPKDSSDKKERRNFKRKWLEERDKHINDYRDSFRTLKNALLKDNNLLDAREYHRLELYCKEIELSNAMEKTIPTDKHPEPEIKSANFNIQKFKEWTDSLHLAFYRNLCEHHTDLLKIVNNLAILVSLFVLFAWGLKELSLIEDYPNRVSKMLCGETIEQIANFALVGIMLDLTKAVLDFCQMILAFDPLVSIVLYSASFNLALVLLALSIFAIGLILYCVIWICLQKQKLFCIFIKIAIKMIKILICTIFCLVFVLGYQTLFIFFVSLLFATLFICFISLKNFVRHLIVSLAYAGFFYTLSNHPSFINPFIGGLFNGDKELPVIFQNPIFITLTIVYSFLMFLLLFSLQKTARKNSIIPT